MNRRQAVVFKMIYGWDNLSIDLQTVLINAGAEKTKYCVDYGERDILWINNGNLDAVLQNSDFWNYLLDGTIKSYKNFNIRTKSDIIDTPNDGLSNDGTMAIFMCDKSDLLYSGAEYLPNSEYQSNFVLTADFIDNRSYIKTWIEERGLESQFVLTKTVGELKEDIKREFNLIGDGNES